MRKFPIVGLLLLVLLGGCLGNGNQAETIKNVDEFNSLQKVAEVKQGDFIYRLISDKEEYKGNEPVKLYATIEYIGERKEITLFHGFTPLGFQLLEKTRNYKIDQAMPAILKSAVYKKGVPVRTDYTKSGGYGETDTKAYTNFIKELWSDGLPTGYYVVDGSAQFYTESPVGAEPDKNQIMINAQIDFKVVRLVG
ncbi:hypothetical protein EHS13_30780 [Paenibacillus psychroresistens]|uniref:Lipoprotein n=1 Tax=Paenibacillus psychroresistens TaxID=1778678 RepID=A0A6B8RU20_9BACL|nr:hypothetical protein [Paenibacillus psychroresistens]QGQ98953.1 hypothetical protein EHS13_30780 [Paenibacillus psychroresistens]